MDEINFKSKFLILTKGILKQIPNPNSEIFYIQKQCLSIDFTSPEVIAYCFNIVNSPNNGPNFGCIG